MANEFATDGTIGTDFTRVVTSAEFTPGKRVDGSKNSEWLFVYAGSGIAQYNLVVVDASGTAINCTTDTASSVHGIAGIAQVSIASGSYGWVATEGHDLKINAAANCADHVRLFTTATAGVVDDAIVSTNGAHVAGVETITTISNATAVACIARNMHLSQLSTT